MNPTKEIVGIREDGTLVFMEGNSKLIHGRSATGKTLLALRSVLHDFSEGRAVVWIDRSSFEASYYLEKHVGLDYIRTITFEDCSDISSVFKKNVITIISGNNKNQQTPSLDPHNDERFLNCMTFMEKYGEALQETNLRISLYIDEARWNRFEDKDARIIASWANSLDDRRFTLVTQQVKGLSYYVSPTIDEDGFVLSTLFATRISFKSNESFVYRNATQSLEKYEALVARGADNVFTKVKMIDDETYLVKGKGKG